MKLGLHDPRPGAIKLRFATYANYTTLPTPPDVFGHHDLITDWGMLGNDDWGDCIAPGTPVLTASLEWVAAGSLRVGDKLLGFDEELQPGMARRRFNECVVENAEIVQRPCYELTFDDGTKVICSSGHRWLTQSTVQGRLGCQQWERTEDLRVGPTRQTRVYKPLDVWTTNRSWDAGYLAAAFDGEGHIEPSLHSNKAEWVKTRVGFSQTDNEMLQQVLTSLKNTGFEPSRVVAQRHTQARVDGTPRKDITRVSIGGRGEFLRFMGSVRPVRLLAKMTGNYGSIPGRKVALVSSVFIGDHDVVMLDTSSRTYFANGLASHNCALAGACHQTMLWTKEGGSQAPFDTPAALRNYHEVAGFDPNAGPPGSNYTDNGTDMGVLARHWQRKGIVDSNGAYHVVVAVMDINPGDLRELWAATYLFQTVGLGFSMPATAMQQFEQGKPWDVVANDGGIEGGHYVPAVGRLANGNLLIVTWGKTQEVTPAFYQKYSNQGIVALSEEMLIESKSIDGFDDSLLKADLKAF